MVQLQEIKSAFELFINGKAKSLSTQSPNCMQKYNRSLGLDFVYSYPAFITLKVTHDCNLRCKHCFYSGTPDIYNRISDSNTECIYELIDFLVDDLNILTLTLTGGEPFVRKDFLDIVQYTKEKFVPLVIQTNGTLITEEIAEKLNNILYKKTDTIHISLEGAEKESHDSIRGAGSFSKTIQAIKMLKKYNLPVQINTTLTSANASTMHNIFDLCDELGINRLSINRFVVCNEEHRYLSLGLDDLFKYNNQILEKSKEFPHISASIKAVTIYDFLATEIGRNLLDSYLEENEIKLRENKCLSCHNNNKLVISAKGDVFLCSMYESEETTLGNLHEKDFYEIWENRFKNPLFQKRDMTTVKCKDCKYISLCGAGCIGSAYLKYGDINMAPAECTYFEEYLRGRNG